MSTPSINTITITRGIVMSTPSIYTITIILYYIRGLLQFIIPGMKYVYKRSWHNNPLISYKNTFCIWFNHPT